MRTLGGEGNQVGADLGIAAQEAVEVAPAEHGEAAVIERGDVGRAPLAAQQCHLAEELTGALGVDALSVDGDLHLALGDQVQGVGGIPRADQALAWLRGQGLEMQHQFIAFQRAAQEAERERRAEADRPVIGEITELWRRFGVAREAAGKSVVECYNAAGVVYGVPDADEVTRLENGEAKYAANTKLPYGYSCYLSDIHRFTRVADLLGVSLDYLCGLTDDPAPRDEQRAGVDLAAPEWQAGNPPKEGEYYACFDIGKNACRLATWSGWDWRFAGGATIEAPCLGWWPLPASMSAKEGA